MKNNITKIIISILLFSFAFLNAEEKNWKFIYQLNGIKIFTHKIEGSTFYECKGIGIVNGTVWTIAALMDDLDSYPEWNNTCTHAELIKPREGNTSIQYFVNSTPMLSKDRDVILKIEQKIDLSKINKNDLNENAYIEIYISSVNEPLVPIKEEYVRIKDLKGKWIIEGLANGKTKLTYIVNTDISGNVPESVSNIVSMDIPYKTILSIKKMVQKEKYILSGKDYTKKMGLE